MPLVTVFNSLTLIPMIVVGNPLKEQHQQNVFEFKGKIIYESGQLISQVIRIIRNSGYEFKEYMGIQYDPSYIVLGQSWEIKVSLLCLFTFQETMVLEEVEEVGVMEGEADIKLLPICHG